MQVLSTVFGQLEVPDDRQLILPMGILGFPHLNRTVIIDVPQSSGLLKWMQSVDQPELGFVLAYPNTVLDSYDPPVSTEDLHSIGLSKPEDAVVMLIATVRDSLAESTVNLQAPLVINPAQRIGRQVVLYDQSLQVRAPLFPARKAVSNTENR